MRKNKNLEELNRHISCELLDSVYLLKILYDLADDDGKICTLLNIIISKVRAALHKTHESRNLITKI